MVSPTLRDMRTGIHQGCFLPKRDGLFSWETAFKYLNILFSPSRLITRHRVLHGVYGEREPPPEDQ